MNHNLQMSIFQKCKYYIYIISTYDSDELHIFQTYDTLSLRFTASKFPQTQLFPLPSGLEPGIVAQCSSALIHWAPSSTKGFVRTQTITCISIFTDLLQWIIGLVATWKLQSVSSMYLKLNIYIYIVYIY